MCDERDREVYVLQKSLIGVTPRSTRDPFADADGGRLQTPTVGESTAHGGGRWVKSLDSVDVDHARETIARRFEPYTMRPLDNGRDFHAVSYGLAGGSIGIHRMTYGGPIEVSAHQPLGNYYCVAHALGGPVRLLDGGEHIDLTGDVSVVCDERRTISSMRGAGTDLVLVRIDLAAMHRQLGDLVPGRRPDARFAMSGPVTSADRARWQAVVRMLEQCLSTTDASGVSDVLWADSLERFTVGALLSTHPHTFADAPEAARHPSASSRAAAEAADFLRAHHDQPIRVGELAARLHVSPRALQIAFRRDFGRTVTDYLRELRLISAHRQLADDPDATVAGVAHRWGFSSSSRFAAQHRAHFGVSPSAVRRTR